MVNTCGWSSEDSISKVSIVNISTRVVSLVSISNCSLIQINMKFLLVLAIFAYLQLAECHLGSTTVNWKYYYLQAVMPAGNYCGQRKPITGWTTVRDRYKAYNSGGNVDNTYFANGVFTTPSAGVYHCCGAARCKQGGVCDFTLSKNGGTNVLAAFGTRVTRTNEWQSVSTCVTERFALGATIQMNMESTGGADCIEETGWDYTKFSCFYLSPN
ncbi:uncharacterized protein LOC111704217 [Eurytemora carolleeae]|uniref:uncharacterized protein LOC111704217 n=1 Tax=Eurytemora carolleeae TaxID=1294199 RepID=UPI000C75FFE0|nr:uncharacterized protein LOC111704217 [Eurytemora carolleeae]|eukprot:XP_023332137.1 uncharacterized protein LOC111704217 [Eurytemora affinis]